MRLLKAAAMLFDETVGAASAAMLFANRTKSIGREHPPTESRAQGAGFNHRSRVAASLLASAAMPFAKPNRIPIRIVTHTLRQSSPYRVGNDVSGYRYEIFVFPHGVIVKTCIPHGRSGRASQIHRARRRTLDSTCQGRKRIGCAKFDQPMPMVRHQNPAKQARLPEQGARMVRPNKCPCTVLICKYGPATQRAEREEIDAADFADTTGAQVGIAALRKYWLVHRPMIPVILSPNDGVVRNFL
jgi:hypothetical protein